MIVDANLLLHAVNDASPFHAKARPWLLDRLAGPGRIALPWACLLAVHRIATNRRILPVPLDPISSWEFVETLLEAPATWVPQPTQSHAAVLGALVRKYGIAGNLTPDAEIAALAIEHSIPVASADNDFALFDEIRWINPLASR